MKFVNADVIAQGLSGFDAESAALQAGRIMLDRLHELAGRRESFAFETTLATRSFAPWLGGLRQTGYKVLLLYFWLESADLAVTRVALRVSEGGHHVPESTVRQCYHRGLRNFFTLYRPITDQWRMYNNTRGGPPEPVAEGLAGNELIFDPSAWQRLLWEATR
jgi:predicted ABC-type ATPase